MPNLLQSLLHRASSTTALSTDYTVPTLAEAPPDGAILYLVWYSTIASGAPAVPTLSGNIGGATDWAQLFTKSDATGNQRLTVFRGNALAGATTGGSVVLSGETQTGHFCALIQFRNVENSTAGQTPVTAGPTAGVSALSPSMTVAGSNGLLCIYTINSNQDFTEEAGYENVLAADGGEHKWSSPGSAIGIMFLDQPDANNISTGTFSGSGRMMAGLVEVPHGTDAPTASTVFELVAAVSDAMGSSTELTFDPPEAGLTGTPTLNASIGDETLEVTGAAARELGVVRYTNLRVEGGQFKCTAHHRRYGYESEALQASFPAGYWIDGALEESLAATDFAGDSGAVDTPPFKPLLWWDNPHWSRGGCAPEFVFRGPTKVRVRVQSGEPIPAGGVVLYVKARQAGDWTGTTEIQQYVMAEEDFDYEEPLDLGVGLKLPTKGREFTATVDPDDFLDVDNGSVECWVIAQNEVGAVHNTQTDPAAETCGIRRGYMIKPAATDHRVTGVHARCIAGGTAVGAAGIHATEAAARAAGPSGCYEKTTAGQKAAAAAIRAYKLATYGGGTDAEFDNLDGCYIHLDAGEHTTPEWSAAGDNAPTFWCYMTIKGAPGGGTVINNRDGADGNQHGWRTSLPRFEDVKFSRAGVDKVVPCGNGEGDTDAYGWDHVNQVPLANDVLCYPMTWNCEKAARDKADVFQVFGDGAVGNAVFGNWYVHDVQTAVTEAPEAVLGLLMDLIGKDGVKGKIRNKRGVVLRRKSAILGKCDGGVLTGGTSLAFDSPELAAMVFRVADDNWRVKDDSESVGSDMLYRVTAVSNIDDAVTLTIEAHTADFASYTGGAYTHGGGTPRLLVKAGAFAGRGVGDTVWVNSATGLGAPFEDTIAVKIDSDQVQLTTGNAGMDGAPDVAFDAATAGVYAPADPNDVFAAVWIGASSVAHGDGDQGPLNDSGGVNISFHLYDFGQVDASHPAWQYEGKGLQYRSTDTGGPDPGWHGLGLRKCTFRGGEYLNIGSDDGAVSCVIFDDVTGAFDSAGGVNRNPYPGAFTTRRQIFARRSCFPDFGPTGAADYPSMDCGAFRDSDSWDRATAWGLDCTYGGDAVDRFEDLAGFNLNPKAGGQLAGRIAVDPALGFDFDGDPHDGSIGAQYLTPPGGPGYRRLGIGLGIGLSVGG